MSQTPKPPSWSPPPAMTAPEVETEEDEEGEMRKVTEGGPAKEAQSSSSSKTRAEGRGADMIRNGETTTQQSKQKNGIYAKPWPSDHPCLQHWNRA